MKVLIVGAGGQGGPCASILSRDADVEEIRLMDIKPEIAEEAAAHIKNPKIKTGTINALDPDDVAKAAEGTDVIIDLVMPWMAPYVMKGALKANVDYVNTAFDTPFWDELVDGKELTLDREFKEAGLTALLGCGMAPGFTNVIARLYANKLDQCTGIIMRIGKKKLSDNKYADFLTPWNPGWSPKQALIDCSNPSYALVDGKYVLYPPFGGIEDCDFTEPIGRTPVTHHSHEEIYSMPRTFKDLKECNFKYFLQPPTAMLYSLGLTSQDEIKVGGIMVKPLDVVAACIPNPGNNFINENAEKLAEADKTFFFEIIIEVCGIKDEKLKTYRVNCPKMNAPGPKLLELFGTSLVNVALPRGGGSETDQGKENAGYHFCR